MNNIVVAKFGGSSLADANQFLKVKNIVLADENRKFVVPSAPGKRNNKDYKITDLLYLCQEHVQKGVPFDDVFKLIEQRYMDLVHDLSIDVNMKLHLEEVRNKIEAGASAEYTASRGEYLNGIILANYLDFEFIDAADIIFFDRYGALDFEKTQSAIDKRFVNVKKAVIPGFYGSTLEGEIKTFSRSGSDITGSIIARCVSAKLYENWTDVSGFLMADPRIVNNPKPIKNITYKELRELAYMGATVLHEDAIFPVMEPRIPINIKNTNLPQEPGTYIISDLDMSSKTGTITGIAGKKDFTVIAIEKMLLNAELGFCRKLLSILETFGVSFENMPAGIDTVSLVIEDSQLENKLDKIIDEIKRQCNPDSIEVHPNMALIATVGNGMAKSKGISGKIFTALSKEDVNIRMINQGSSEINIIVGVENNDFEKAIKAIYNHFVN